MTLKAVKQVLIVGGGTAGWMTAAMLVRLMGPQLDIRLIESATIGTVGVGEATIPAIQHFNAALGIEESEFLRATGGTIKLGIQFENWGQHGDSYMHAFGPIGRALGVTPFHHYWLAAKRQGHKSAYSDYSLNFLAARAGKYAPLPQIPGTPLQGLQHAYHFDAGLYAAFLRRYAEQRGVLRTEGEIIDVQQTVAGDIASVTLKNGQQYSADLFIDCSGSRALLIGDTLGVGYENWQHWLPCDSALAAPTSTKHPIIPFTRAVAHDAGWQWQIPLQHRMGNGVVYSSQYLNDDLARQMLLANLDTEVLDEPRKISFTAGRRYQSWYKNCVAIGLAAGFLEPLESTSIHLIQTAVVRLVQCFPQSMSMDAVSTEFNRQAQDEIESIRDFIILHYHLNQRAGQGLWHYCRTMLLPDSLRQRIELFKQSAAVFRHQDELFTEAAWTQVMLGQHLQPLSYHPMADMLSSTQRTDFLTDLSSIMTSAVARLPSYQQFLHSLSPGRA